MVVACGSVAYVKQRRERNRQRKLLVKEWLKNRDEKGGYHNKLHELRMVDLPYYRRFIKMNPETFKVRI